MPANQSNSSKGRQASEGYRARHPTRQQRGTGEGVQATPGRAHHREPLHLEGVGEPRHIGRRRRHIPARMRARTAI
jgi:hypothetical protein